MKFRVSELNINGFKIYKDGNIELPPRAKEEMMNDILNHVHENLDFNSLSRDFKTKMLQYVISNWNKETGEYSILADKKS